MIPHDLCVAPPLTPVETPTLFPGYVLRSAGEPADFPALEWRTQPIFDGYHDGAALPWDRDLATRFSQQGHSNFTANVLPTKDERYAPESRDDRFWDSLRSLELAETRDDKRLLALPELSRAEVALYSAYLLLHDKLTETTEAIFNPEPPTDFLDENSVIVVTGASQGVGAELVKTLATQARGTIVLVARSVDRMHELARELVPTSKARFHVIGMDLGLSDSAAVLSHTLIRDGLVPTVLVLNAGMSSGKPALEMTVEERQHERRLNEVTPMELILSLGPVMEGLPGRRKIIYVGSMLAFFGAVGNSTYGATRGAMRNFLRAFRNEVGVNFPSLHHLALGQVATAQSQNFRHPLVPLDTPVNSARIIASCVTEQDPPFLFVPGKLNNLIRLSDIFFPSLTNYMGGVVSGVFKKLRRQGKYRRRR